MFWQREDDKGKKMRIRFINPMRVWVFYY